MLRSFLLTILLLGAALVGGSIPAEAATCSHVNWGSLEKVNLVQGGDIAAVRAGQQPCYDRLVFDLAGPRTGYDVQYVSVVYDVARGEPLNVPGGARLAVVVFGNSLTSRTPSVAGFSTFRSVVYGGSFEAVTIYGLGVRARLPFRVFTLPNPNRLVIDVAKTW
jgi:hypothetical protein